MVRDTVRSLWAEPRAAQPPARVWRDWVLVAGLVPTALLEGLLRADVEWRPVSLLLGVGLPFVLLWRRTHPLGRDGGVRRHHRGRHRQPDRWCRRAGGALRDGLRRSAAVLAGALGERPRCWHRFGFILVTLVLSIAIDYTGIGDSVGGSIFLLFPATLAAAVRYWTTSRLRERDQVKLRERAELARELHDTVAHHVSAIAIRAQAGRVVASTNPEAALDALEVIEQEASRALAELRMMVGGLREEKAATLVPQPGVADLERLARSMGDRPRVEVDLSGDLDDLWPSVEAAVYRIAQESVTNAVRHARHATRIQIRVAGDADCVRLTVSDDGDAGPAASSRTAMAWSA